MDPIDRLYAPPQHAGSGGDVPERGERLEDASTNRRFANLLLDSVGRFLFGIVVAIPCRLLRLDIAELPGSFVFGLSSVLVYYVFFEWAFGFTLGKLLTGTRVVGLDGRRPGFGSIFLRTFVRFVPFEPFSFLTGDRRGWHDRWSGTRVVRARR